MNIFAYYYGINLRRQLDMLTLHRTGGGVGWAA